MTELELEAVRSILFWGDQIFGVKLEAVLSILFWGAQIFGVMTMVFYDGT